MKTLRAGYRYTHPNGSVYEGTIEAETPEELVRLMQDEIDASEGAMDRSAFVVDVPELAEVEVLAKAEELTNWSGKACPTCSRPLDQSEELTK